jgi:hypothetical protein
LSAAAFEKLRREKMSSKIFMESGQMLFGY